MPRLKKEKEKRIQEEAQKFTNVSNALTIARRNVQRRTTGAKGKLGGLSGRDRLELAQARAKRAGLQDLPVQINPQTKDILTQSELQKQREEELQPAIFPQQEQSLEKQFEEAGVFKEVSPVSIIPPQKVGGNFENVMSVMKDIGISLLPESFKKGLEVMKSMELGNIVNNQNSAAIENELIKDSMNEITSSVIDEEIEKVRMIQNGIGLGSLAGVAGSAVIGSSIAGPVSEFVGTDGQIASLEMALSQYNEMLTLPSRAMDSGLPSEMAFEKLNVMEEEIKNLENQLKKSAITSMKVRIALKNTSVEARIFKLRQKLQNERGIVAQKTTAQTFGEADIPKSILFLQELRRKKKAEKDKRIKKIFGPQKKS